MKFDADLIRQLIIEDIAGVISARDKALLQQIIAEDKDAYALYQEKRTKLITPEMDAAVAARPGVDFILSQNRRLRRVRILRRMAGAAATIVLVGILYLLLRPGVKQASSSAVATSSKHIELQLGHGNIIDLTSSEGQVQAGSVTLNNTNKTLTYHADVISAEIATLKVPAGKDYKLTLADGTQVWLNSATMLHFPVNFTGNTREVTISGEAYLQVAKDAKKPFIVHFANREGAMVQVLGTEFNINTYDSSKIQVALVEGSVKMKNRQDSIVLMPGYEVISTTDAGMLLTTFDAFYTLAWKKGQYIFRDAPLAEVIQVLPRWFGVEVVMDNRQLAGMHFTGIIDRNQPIKKSLELLKATNEFNYRISGDTVHIQ